MKPGFSPIRPGPHLWVEGADAGGEDFRPAAEPQCHQRGQCAWGILGVELSGQAQRRSLRSLFAELHRHPIRESLLGGGWASSAQSQRGQSLFEKLAGTLGITFSAAVRAGFESGRICLELHEEQWGFQEALEKERVIA